MTLTCRRKARATSMLAAALALAVTAPTFAAGPKAPTGHDQFIVRFKDHAPEHDNAADRQRLLQGVGHRQGLRLDELRRLGIGADVMRTHRKLDAAQAKALIVRLRSHPSVEFAEIDLPVYPVMAPNDPLYDGSQWNHHEPGAGINAPAAWDLASGAGQVVAVLDTGTTRHADLDANLLAGYDFISDLHTAADGTGRDAVSSDPGDWTADDECGAGEPGRASSWHGTQVAGAIGAVADNGIGLAGVAFSGRVLPVRVLGRCGGISSDLSDAIRWAAGLAVAGVPANTHVAKVINLSLGGPGACPATTQTAIDQAVAAGSTVVVAAGNDSVDIAGFQPANCAHVVVVGAVGRSGARATYSNHGAGVDIAAPGGDGPDGVASLSNDGATVPAAATYRSRQGTSMAAPHVAGVAALVRSGGGAALTPAQMEALLKVTSKSPPKACTAGCGVGLVDAHAAVVTATQAVLDVTDPVAVTEGDSGTRTVVFRVNLSRPVDTPVTFDIATADGLARAPSDYIALRATAQTIPAGQLGKTFAVTVVGDAIPERRDEFFVVNLGNVSGPVTVVDDQGIARITEDDTITLQRGDPYGVLASSTIGEQVRFRIDVPPGASDLRFSTAGGTGDADLAVKFGSPPTSIDDGDCASIAVGNEEACHLGGRAGTWHALLQTHLPYSGVTLVATYATPATNATAAPAFSIASLNLVEGDSGTQQAIFTVKLATALTYPVTYNLVTYDTGATAGSDYVGLSLLGQTWPPGQLSQSFAVTVNGDTAIEGNEQFDVVMRDANGSWYASGGALIRNDDGPTLSIGNATVVEGNTRHVMTFTVTLSEAAAVPVTFQVSSVDGTAESYPDYDRFWTDLSIPAGQLSKTFDVSICGETLVEANEYFLVNLNTAGGATVFDSQAVGWILNDDGWYLTIADATTVEGHSGGRPLEFVVSLSKTATSPVPFAIATSNGSAAAGSDYTASNLTGLSIPAGQLTRTFSIPVTGDTVVEANENFFANLSTTHSVVTVLDARATGWILNDDGPTLSINDPQVVEGHAGTKVMTFTAALSQAATVPVTYTVATSNGTAIAPGDYVARGVVGETIPAGQLSKTFAVTLYGDMTIEPNETLAANLSSASGASILDYRGVGTILNDDGPSLSVADVSTTEGDSGTRTLEFTVRLSEAVAGPVTYSIATSNGTALAGSDYVAAALTGQTLAAGELSQPFQVTILGDTAVEASEAFAVNLTDVTGVSVLRARAVGTITNDD